MKRLGHSTRKFIIYISSSKSISWPGLQSRLMMECSKERQIFMEKYERLGRFLDKLADGKSSEETRRSSDHH
jgi:hypothetical protein